MRHLCHGVLGRLLLLMFPVFCVAQLLPAVAIGQHQGQEHQGSTSHSSEYVPPLNPPDLDDLKVFLEHLEKLDIEIAAFESTPNPPAVPIIPDSIEPIPVVSVQPQPTVFDTVDDVELEPSLFEQSKPEPVVSTVEIVQAPRKVASQAKEAPEHTSFPKRLVLNVMGTGMEVLRLVPDETGITTGYVEAKCYEIEVYNAASGSRTGRVEYCLSEVSTGAATPSLTGKQLIETASFYLKKGRLVVQELSTLQPLNWTEESAQGDRYTHLTAAQSSSNAAIKTPSELFSNTGVFQKVNVNLRASGMIDLSREQEGVVTVDSVFVLDLS